MLVSSLYVTTRESDKPNHEHHFRLPVTDIVPEGQEIVNVRPAGKFRLSSLLSPESLAVLKSVRSNRR
jgi:hypothetical protein